MNRAEYEKAIKELGVDLESLHIFISRKTNVPFSHGCYFEDGVWHLYVVDEFQHLGVTRKGTEEEVFQVVVYDHKSIVEYGESMNHKFAICSSYK